MGPSVWLYYTSTAGFPRLDTRCAASVGSSVLAASYELAFS